MNYRILYAGMRALEECLTKDDPLARMAAPIIAAVSNRFVALPQPPEES